MTTKELEYAIYKKYFNASKLTITNIKTVVKYECDVAVIGKSDYLTGLELKISKSDLLADFKKKHTHICKKVKKFYYVLPKDLENCIDLIPEEFGVIIVIKGSYIDDFCLKTPLEKTKYNCRIVRESKINKAAEKITVDEYINLCRLASMRAWTQKMNELKNEGLIQWNKAKICDTCKHQEKRGKYPVVIECRECRSLSNWEEKNG